MEGGNHSKDDPRGITNRQKEQLQDYEESIPPQTYNQKIPPSRQTQEEALQRDRGDWGGLDGRHGTHKLCLWVWGP